MKVSGYKQVDSKGQVLGSIVRGPAVQVGPREPLRGMVLFTDWAGMLRAPRRRWPGQWSPGCGHR